MPIKPIRVEADYDRALRRVEELWDAPKDSAHTASTDCDQAARRPLSARGPVPKLRDQGPLAFMAAIPPRSTNSPVLRQMDFLDGEKPQLNQVISPRFQFQIIRRWRAEPFEASSTRLAVQIR